MAGLDRVDDPRGAVGDLGDGGACCKPEAAADGADQLELGLGRLRQRREIGEPRGGN